MATPPRVFSYSRFSSAKQKLGDSLRRQAAARDEFLKRQGLELDTTLRMVDEGVSSFRGDNRGDDAALGQFLKVVKEGRVPKGSYLIVESLDRLSRDRVWAALTLMCELINAGIRVVQLLPVETVYDESSQPMQVMMALMELSRGNSESQVKSERLAEKWETKRTAARATGKAMTAQCPAWLRKVGDRYEPIPDRIATVRRIFALAADGYGIHSIISKLVEERRPLLGRAATWNQTTVHRVLTKRTVLGEFHPTRRGEPDGDPIPDYFPAVIDESLFYRVQAGLRSRTRAGSVGHNKNGVNLFRGLLFNAVDGGRLEWKWFGSRRDRKSHDYALFVNAAHRGSQSPYTSFPAAAIEIAVLSDLREVPAEAVNPTVAIEEDVVAVREQIREVDEQLTAVAEQMIGGKAVKTLTTVAERLETKKTELEGRLEAIRQRASQPGLSEAKSLLEVLATAKDTQDARLRLHTTLANVIERIDCLFLRRGRRQVAYAQITFRDQPVPRVVLCWHRDELQHGSRKTKTPPFTRHVSVRSDEIGGDVRQRTFRATVAKELEAKLGRGRWYAEVEVGDGGSR